MRLPGTGMSSRAIAREVGLSRHTVQRFIRVDAFPERTPRLLRPGILSPTRHICVNCGTSDVRTPSSCGVRSASRALLAPVCMFGMSSHAGARYRADGVRRTR